MTTMGIPCDVLADLVFTVFSSVVSFQAIVLWHFKLIIPRLFELAMDRSELRK